MAHATFAEAVLAGGGRRWQADHVIPHYFGGHARLENYLPICKECNRLRWFHAPEVIRLIMRLGIYAKNEIRHETKLGEVIVALVRKTTSSEPEKTSKPVVRQRRATSPDIACAPARNRLAAAGYTPASHQTSSVSEVGPGCIPWVTDRLSRKLLVRTASGDVINAHDVSSRYSCSTPPLSTSFTAERAGQNWFPMFSLRALWC